MKVHFVCLCTRSKFPSDTDLPAVRLIVAPHRNNCDLSRRQPQRPGWGTEGGDRLAYSYRTIIPLTGYIQILCIIIFSPFPSKIFSQYGHHPLQRSQHCSVDHYWSVQLSVSSERKVTKKRDQEVVQRGQATDTNTLLDSIVNFTLYWSEVAEWK